MFAIHCHAFWQFVNSELFVVWSLLVCFCCVSEAFVIQNWRSRKLFRRKFKVVCEAVCLRQVCLCWCRVPEKLQNVSSIFLTFRQKCRIKFWHDSIWNEIRNLNFQNNIIRKKHFLKSNPESLSFVLCLYCE